MILAKMAHSTKNATTPMTHTIINSVTMLSHLNCKGNEKDETIWSFFKIFANYGS